MFDSRRDSPSDGPAAAPVRRLRAGALLALLCLCALAAASRPALADLRLDRVLPATVYAEPDPRGWRLNFDLILSNPLSAPVAIDYVELEAFDADGHLVTRRHLGGGGTPPAIDMLGPRVVPALGRLQLFNPFAVLPADLSFETLRFGVYYAGGRLQVPITPVKKMPVVLPVLPIGGEVFVESGSDLESAHRRLDLATGTGDAVGLQRNTGRFSVDLTVVDPEGRYRSGERTDPDHWFAWNQEVRTPTAGTVVAVRNDVPDNELLAGGGVQRPADDAVPAGQPGAGPLGNLVIVELSPQVYLVAAHLRRGSVRVAVGDRLWPGALLGRIGLSGDTSWPHLHLQLQRGADLLDSKPLPLVFACVRNPDGTLRRPAWLATGDRVSACRIGADGS